MKIVNNLRTTRHGYRYLLQQLDKYFGLGSFYIRTNITHRVGNYEKY